MRKLVNIDTYFNTKTFQKIYNIKLKKFTWSLGKLSKYLKPVKQENNNNSEPNENRSKEEENEFSEIKQSIFSIDEANKYIEEKVKKFDYYSYVIGKTLPEKLRPHYFAYHGFYLELMRSRYISKELSVNKIRLNFWEDTLKEIIDDKVLKEPMSIALREAFKYTGIRKDTLFRMIDFQFYDINRTGEINSMEDLEIFAENTRSLLIYLNLNLININDRDAFIAASHVGRGVGIVDILKRMPALLKMHVNQIPNEIVSKYGGSAINLWNRHGQIREELFDSVLEIAAYGKKHIEISRTFIDKIPKNTNIAFLQAVESYQWLLDLEKYNFDIFEPQLSKISTYSIPNMMMEKGKKGEY